MDITDLSAAHLSEAIHGGDVSCREVMTAYLDRIDERNPAVNAIVSLRDRDELLAEAAECDLELAHDLSRGWMHGMPQAIKDLAETKGLRTTMGSRLLEQFVPDFDCLMVSRMKDAGCIVIGKTNVPEFGLGSHTFNDVFGTTRNPFDPTRSAGGSSGGAAVALATHMLPVADGSDYMGSLRNPAAWNNVFGFRPSQGRVPGWPERDGYLAQLATEGPMGRTVLDVAMLLGTQAGLRRQGAAVVVGPPRRVRDSGVGPSRVGAPTRWSEGGLARRSRRPSGDGTWHPRALRRRAACGLESFGCTVDPTAFGISPERVWEAWLVWRHVLVSGNLSPLLTDPTRRELMKPEALWEVDNSRHITRRS